jgi:hypothetical protein
VQKWKRPVMAVTSAICRNVSNSRSWNSRWKSLPKLDKIYFCIFGKTKWKFLKTLSIFAVDKKELCNSLKIKLQNGKIAAKKGNR